MVEPAALMHHLLPAIDQVDHVLALAEGSLGESSAASSNCFALEAGDDAGILDVSGFSGIEASELALELARELGREPSGTRAMDRDVRSRASSDTSEATLDVAGFFPNFPLESRA